MAEYSTLKTLKLIVVAIVISVVVSASALTPVEIHGNLTTKGGYILDKNGKIVQLRGMSFYWTTATWGGEKYYTAATVDALVDSWKCNVLRVAYDQKTDGNDNGWRLCQTVINEAIKKGVYVIIDWHSHTADKQADVAVGWFKSQATNYKNTPNVIFEPFNEPITSDGTTDGSEATAYKTWSAIKPYLKSVTKAIRDAGADNLVILGTPYFAQFVYIAAQDPVVDDAGKMFKNVAYTFHFYAASHGGDAYYVTHDNPNKLGGLEEDYLKKALGVIPIFITEWGTTHSDGGAIHTNGEADHLVIDETNTDYWFNKYVHGEYHLSTCNWSVSDFQTSSAFASGATAPSLNPSKSGTIVKRLLTTPTTDSWDPPWILGYEGPAKDTVFNMPGTQPMARYNRSFGSAFSVVAVSYSDKDNLDARTANRTSLKEVSGGAADEWVSYSIDSKVATKNIFVRYLDTTGIGTIDVYVDDVKAGTLTFQKNTTWVYAIAPLAVPAGKHILKLKFTGAVGAGYMMEWFELTNSDVSVSRQLKTHFFESTKLSFLENGFYLELPQAHMFSSYSLTSIDGRIVKNGKIKSSTTQLKFNNLTTGMWLLKLEGTEGVKLYKIVVNRN
jgi:endoglucanase